MFRTPLKQAALFFTLSVTPLLLTSCQRQPARAPEAAGAPAREASATQAPFDVDAVMRQVHFAYRPEEDGWRGGHSTYDVKATAQGLTLTPVHVKTLEPEEPERPEPHAHASLPPPPEVELGAALFLGSAQVTRGETRLSVAAPRGKVEADGHLAFAHGAVVEHLRNSEQGVEQSWSFEAAPSGKGDLRVRIPVKGLRYTQASEQGLHFADARTGLGFRYGHGTWVDGKGRRTAVPAEYAHGQIQLRVPAEVLAASSYPAVLDPVISQEMIIDGRQVTADLSIRVTPSLAFNGTNYLLVWRNVRGGIYNIYATRVSSSGTVLDTAGILVSPGPGTCAVPQVASNGTDFYVVWSQYHTGDYGIRGTRVTSSGEVSTPGGIRLSQGTINQSSPQVASNGTDYLAVWYGSNSASDHDVHARRVSSTGTVLDSSDIVIADQQGYDEDFPVVASNGTVYLVVWYDHRNSSYHAYATRVSNAGAVLDGTGFALSPNTVNIPYAVGSNGTNFLAVWSDYRNTTTADLYASRVTGSGTVVDGSGLAVATDTAMDDYAGRVASNGTDYLVAWRARTVSGTDTTQIRGSRVSSSASSSSAVLDTTSLAISSTSTTLKLATIAPAGTGYLVAWDDLSSSGSSDLYNAWVSSTGTVTAGSGFSLTGTLSSVSETEPAVASNGTNYLVVWTDSGSSGQQIYGARVSTQGNLLDASPLAITASVRERQSPAVASNGTDYFVTWMDYRNVNWDIYGTRVSGSSASSSAVVDTSGIAVSTSSAFQNAPDVASNGTDYFVVWRQDAGGRGDVYGARVTSAGVVQDTSGIAIATNVAEHYTPRVASNGSNYLTVWAEYLNATSWDIYGARVSSAGVLLDTSGIAISSATREQYDPDVASNGTDYFAVWTDYRSGSNYDVYGARVSGAGVLQDSSGLAVCTDTAQQYSPRVTYDGTDYVSAWADHRWSTSWLIYATQISSSGTVSSSLAQMSNYVRPGTPDPTLASGGSQQSFVVHSHHDVTPDQGSQRIRGKFLSF